MKYNFDEIVDRKLPDVAKWCLLEKNYGNTNAWPMWVADMEFATPKPIIEALKERAARGDFGYTERTDTFPAALKGWIERRHGYTINPDWVCFSPGIVPALNVFVQAVTNPGDSVIVMRPVYSPFSDGIVNNGRKVSVNSMIETDGVYTIDFDDLEKRAADPYTKLMFLSNPHNPVGRVFTKDELQKIGDICLKNDVVIISDEVHSDFVYDGHKHIPFTSVDSRFEQNAVLTYAPSKTFNLAGLQTSAIVIPNPKLRAEFTAQLTRNRVYHIPTFGKVAFETAYNECDDYADQLADYVYKNYLHFCEYLAKNMPLLSLSPMEGTYLAWMDCRKLNLTEEELNHFFVFEAEVAGDNGIWFGDEAAGFMRLNIASSREFNLVGYDRIKKAYDKAGF